MKQQQLYFTIFVFVIVAGLIWYIISQNKGTPNAAIITGGSTAGGGKTPNPGKKTVKKTIINVGTDPASGIIDTTEINTGDALTTNKATTAIEVSYNGTAYVKTGKQKGFAEWYPIGDMVDVATIPPLSDDYIIVPGDNEPGIGIGNFGTQRNFWALPKTDVEGLG